MYRSLEPVYNILTKDVTQLYWRFLRNPGESNYEYIWNYLDSYAPWLTRSIAFNSSFSRKENWHESIPTVAILEGSPLTIPEFNSLVEMFTSEDIVRYLNIEVTYSNIPPFSMLLLRRLLFELLTPDGVETILFDINESI